MKQIVCTCLIALAFYSCSNGKPGPTTNDSSAAGTDTGRTVIGTGAGGADSLQGGALNGARVSPLDTTKTSKPKP